MDRKEFEFKVLKRSKGLSGPVPDPLWKAFEGSGFEPGKRPVFFEGRWRAGDQVGVICGSRAQVRGVDLIGKRWRARMKVKGKHYMIGMFDTEAEALAAREKWPGPPGEVVSIKTRRAAEAARSKRAAEVQAEQIAKMEKATPASLSAMLEKSRAVLDLSGLEEG